MEAKTPPVEIRGIPGVEVRAMRRLVLRPDLHWEQLNYQGDNDADSLHAGAYMGGVQQGIASVYRMSPAEATECAKYQPAITELSYREEKPGMKVLWRLRGMATLPSARGFGFGGRLLEACIGHAARRGGQRIWCTARIGFAGFYQRYGFSIDSSEFQIPNAGPHYFMSRLLSIADKDCERGVIPAPPPVGGGADNAAAF